MVFDKVRMSPAQARHLNPRQWAFVGDAVYDLFARTYAAHTDYPLPKMHKMSVAHARADAQANYLTLLEPFLTEEEADIVRRSRNERTHSSNKNADAQAYCRASSLEGLVGYLYLTGQDERLETLMQKIFMEDEHGR